MRLRRRVNQILRSAATGDVPSRICDVFILAMIALSVVAIILESVASLRGKYANAFRCVELITVAVFSAEYLLRLWSCVEENRYRAPITGRLRFSLTPMALIDLAAVLPFYLPFVGLDLRFLRIVRMLRLFRVAKIGRYSTSVQLLGRVLRAKKEELGVTLFVLILPMILAACLLYNVENAAQPEAFSSIPASMW